MPLTKEERAEIAQETATTLAATLKPMFDGLTTALGDLKTAQESKGKVEETALTAREINEKITAANLSEGAVKRVYLAVEAEGVVATEKLVDEAIARETEVMEEARAALQAEKGEGHGVFNEAGEAGGSNEYKPGTVKFSSSKGAQA